MFLYTIAICLLFLMASAAPTSPIELKFKAISLNVRGTATKDQLFPHEELWEDRKEPMLDVLTELVKDKPTLLATQETHYNQVEDILEGFKHLDGDWTYFGHGRDDGDKEGEIDSIFYNSKVWELISGETKWLSETPNTPSLGWDASIKRTVSVTVFKHRESGVKVNCLNTHFDHEAQESQKESAKMIVDIVNNFDNDYETVVMGDFNVKSNETAYQIITDDMDDTRQMAQDIKSTQVTTTGFEPDDEQKTICYIFVPEDANEPDSKIKALSYDVKSNDVDGTRISDHRPVVVEIGIMK